MDYPFGLKSIIFDMDGVITLTMPFHYRAWKKIFASQGIYVSKFEVYSREGQKGIQSIIEIFKEHNKTITPSNAQALLERKESLFKEIPRTPFVSGARTFIKRYYRNGMRLGLVTGTARNEIQKILPEELLACFEVIISGNDVRHGKPHPEPYLKALKKLKINRGEAVVIENAPFGITSAVSAGLKCIALETSLPKKFLKDADCVVKNYQELEIYFRKHYMT